MSFGTFNPRVPGRYNANNATSDLRCARIIVSSNPLQGDYTTIAGALAGAVSGQTIFLMPGTYTENITLKAGVNITAFTCDAITPNVTISGTATATFAGTCTLSGIRLQTNGSYLLTVSGSDATLVKLVDCYINCTNNTGISFTSSNSAAEINIHRCFGDITTTGIALFSSSSAGNIIQYWSDIVNSGSTSTASTLSSGTYTLRWSRIYHPLTTSSTGVVVGEDSIFDTGSTNSTGITLAGTGALYLFFCRMECGSGSCISIGSGTSASVRKCSLGSTNANVVTGAGTFTFTDINFSSSGITINPTTQTAQYTNLGCHMATGQPAFSAKVSSVVDNVTGDGTEYTVISTTELFDQASNYNNGTGIFTAPITGRYQFNGFVLMQNTTSGMAAIFEIITSNNSFLFGNLATINVNGNFPMGLSIFCDMDAADTADMRILLGNGSKVADLYGGGDIRSGFSGFLVC
jgi:hypothetical protein